MNWLKNVVISLLIICFVVPLNTVSFPKKVSAAKIDKEIVIPRNLAPEKKNSKSAEEKELTDLRTIYSKTYQKSENLKQQVTSLEPMNYPVTVNGKTEYKTINNDLVPQITKSPSNSTVYQNKSNSFKINISEAIFNDGVSIFKDQYKVKIVPQTNKQSSNGLPTLNKAINKTFAKTAVSKRSISLDDMASSIQYKYTSTSTGVKEEIILNRYTGQNQFAFNLELSNNLQVSEQNGALYFRDLKTNALIFNIPPSFAYDASYLTPANPEGSITTNVKTELIKTGNKSYIKLTLDKDWLTDKKRKYPVTIDPTIDGSFSGNDDTYIQQGFPNTGGYAQDYLYAGYARVLWYNPNTGRNEYAYKNWTRILLPFNVTELNNVTINSASVSVYQRQNFGNHGLLGRMVSNFTGSAATWNNQPAYSGEAIYNQNSCTECAIKIDVTQLAKYWYEQQVTNFKHGYISFWDDNDNNDGKYPGSYFYRQWNNNSAALSIDYTTYNAEYSFNNIHTARADDPYSFGVNVHNLGSSTLFSGNTKVDFTIYKNGQQYDWFERQLPYDVGAGQWGTINIDYPYFDEPGNYTIETDIYNGNIGWYSLLGIGSGLANFTITDFPEYAATYEVSGIPSSSVAGSTINVPLNIQNNSRYDWPANQYKVSYHWVDNSTGKTIIQDGQKVDIPATSRRYGWAKNINLPVAVPGNAGSYKLKIDIVQPGVLWFSDRGIATKDYNIAVSLPPLSSITRLGNEDYYAKAGPVDLATGNLSYSSTDLSLASNTGLLSFERSYNAVSLDKTYDPDASGYIRNWLINGPYYQDNQSLRLSTPYINEETIRPNAYATAGGKAWLSAIASSDKLDINQALESNGVAQSGYATNSVVYGHVYVYSPIDQTPYVWSGSDEASKIWINGVLCYTKDLYFDRYTSNDIFTASLKAGWNSILMKVSNKNAGFQLSFKFADYNGMPVTGLKYAVDNPDLLGDSQLMGKGWTNTVSEKLFAYDPNNIYYRDSSGSINLYTKNPDNTYKKPSGSSLNLVKQADGSFYLSSKSGLKINFDISGKVINRIDLSGNKLEYTYDTMERCTKISDSGRYIAIEYTNKLISKISDHAGNSFQYQYDTTSFPVKLTMVTDQKGNSFSYSYNSSGKISKYTNKKGIETKIEYYSSNKVSKLTDGLANTTDFVYREKSTDIIDPLGKKSTFIFDKNNLLISSINAKGYKELYQYDGDYNIVRIIPDIPENDWYFYNWSYEYDSNSNLTKETNPLSEITSYSYSGNDLTKIIYTDATTNEFIYSTDGRRLLMSEKDAKGNTTSYSYDSLGRLTSTTDPLGNRTSLGYNTFGDLISATSPKGEVNTFSVDSLGRQIKFTSPLGKNSFYSYDARNLLVQAIDPANLIYKLEYDKNDNLIKEVNPVGSAKTYEYDVLGRLIKITDETGSVISYEYDKIGNLIKMTDANGKSTTYKYDELGQLISEIGPDGKETKVEYDRNGNANKVIDPKGQITTEKYNKLGQTIESTDNSGTVSLNYNNAGNVSSVVAGEENVNLTYDLNQNLTAVNSNIAGNSSTAYNKNDAPVTINTSQNQINLGYDANGQTSQINTKINSQTLSTTFTRDKEGKLTNIVKPNGDNVFVSYDLANKVTNVTNRNKYKALLSQFVYKYDKLSNIVGVYEGRTRVTNSYVYDAKNQLIKENGTAYAYDPIGNRLSKTIGMSATTYQYDSLGDANRLLKVTSPDSSQIQYEYDANGNIIKKIDSRLGTTSYFYDADDYFIKAVLPNNTIIEYTYDKALKRRIQRLEKPISGVTLITKFVYDGDRLVSETDATGKVLKIYTWDQSEKLIGVSIPDSAGNLQYYSYSKNIKEDITELTDTNGNIVAEYKYDAWGNILSSKTTTKSTIPNLDKINTRLYSSYWYDSTLQLYFMKARMYDSVIGRFLSKDPITIGGSALGYNPYIYCGNNPVNRIDPSGKFWHIVAGAVIGALVGATFSAVSQYVTTGTIDWKEVGISAAVGAVGGAIFAASMGLGLIAAGAISGAVSSGLGYVARQAANNQKVNARDAIVNTVIGGATGAATAYVGTIALAKFGNVTNISTTKNNWNKTTIQYHKQIGKESEIRNLEFHPAHNKGPHDSPHWQINIVRGYKSNGNAKVNLNESIRFNVFGKLIE